MPRLRLRRRRREPLEEEVEEELAPLVGELGEGARETRGRARRQVLVKVGQALCSALLATCFLVGGLLLSPAFGAGVLAGYMAMGGVVLYDVVRSVLKQGFSRPGPSGEA